MHGRFTCVLVDDDPIFRAFAHEILSMVQPDALVVEFRDGLDALDYVACHRVDLLLTDFRMPRFDGLRLTEIVRLSNEKVTILVMSGEDVRSEALKRGATGFILKQSLMAELSSRLVQIGLKPDEVEADTPV